jgi:hypothetical protein
MPYILTKSNGTQLTVIQDGSLDNSTDLTFVGKNYAGYGQVQNENLVKLLENFANNTNNPPSKPLTGQLWYDTSRKKLNVYNGATFQEFTLGNTISATKPTDQTIGDFYWDAADQKLYVYNGLEYVLIGPPGNSSPLVSSIVASTVNDAVPPNTHVILKGKIGNDTPAIFSSVDFQPDSGSDIVSQGFSYVKRGITLPGTSSSSGVSSGASYFFWGTAGDSLKLGGLDASNYVLRSSLTGLPSLTLISDDGILVGLQNVMRLHAKSTVGFVSNIADQTINFNVRDTPTSATSSTVVTMTSNGGLSLAPGSGKTVFLGNNGNAFADTYSTVIHTGKITTSVTDNVATTGTIVGNWTVKGTISLANADSAVSATFANTSTNATYLANSNNTGFIHSAVDGSNNSIAQIDPTGALNIKQLKSVGSNSTIDGSWLLTTNSTLQATSIKAGGSYVVPDATATGNTVALRDTDGGITAAALKGSSLTTPTINAGSSNNSNGVIYGQWTLAAQATLQATYADLAERYASDRPYNPGTVTVIGGEAEITLCLERAAVNWAGVISTNPAFKLNGGAGSDASHPFVALTGKVPCLVVGPIKKGDLLVTSKYPGHAEAWQPGDSPLAVIGKALESLDGDGTGTIQIKV